MIEWQNSKEDEAVIAQIVARAMKELRDKPSGLELSMDISCCHAIGCPLDLERLLKAERFDFLHDVVGIRGHLDRTTGKLLDCFRPRFARRR